MTKERLYDILADLACGDSGVDCAHHYIWGEEFDGVTIRERDVSKALGGCKDSKLRGDDGLLAATMRCVDDINKIEDVVNSNTHVNMSYEVQKIMRGETDIHPGDEWLECDDCHQGAADVVVTTCPYTSDVNNKVVPATLCKDCYRMRAMDI